MNENEIMVEESSQFGPGEEGTRGFKGQYRGKDLYRKRFQMRGFYDFSDTD